MKTFNKVLSAIHFSIFGMSMLKIVETHGSDKIAFGLAILTLLFGVTRMMEI